MPISAFSPGRLVPLLMFLFILPAGAAPAEDDAPAPPPWPRIIKQNGAILKLYPPQIDSWVGDQLKGRAVVEAQAKADAPSVYGVVTVTARTLVDREERTVDLGDYKVEKAEFPTGGDAAKGWLKILQDDAAGLVRSVPLDRLESALASSQEQSKLKRAVLRNEPPTLVFSQKPSVMIRIDGPPSWKPVPGAKVDYVLNTRVLLVRDSAGTQFLRLGDGWMTAPKLSGPWTVAGTGETAGLAPVLEWAGKQKTIDTLSGSAGTADGTVSLAAAAPVVYVVLKPSELIVTDGEPKFEPIYGTNLSYVKNTSGNVFRPDKDGALYVLVSGRWFQARNFDGPWSYVPGSKLPEDFAKIPDTSPKENVLASVPGTPEALEAAIANQVPQMASIDRKTATFTPVVDGAAKMIAIPNTELSYVANSPDPLIKAGGSWMAVHNGVWFSAPKLDGPWVVATEVPLTIYSIPPSCAIYYVTFVRIYRVTDDTVVTGYTPGYYGAVLGEDGTVVYGTGYDYNSWSSDSCWYGAPETYGSGACSCWTPWDGWSVGFGFGWYYSSWDDWWYPPAPWWGPYHGWGYNNYGGITAWGPGGWAGTTGNIYRNWGDWQAVSRAEAGYNAYTGNQWARTYGKAYNSRTGAVAVGGRGAVENVYTGDYAKTAGGVAVSGDKNKAIAAKQTTVGNSNTGNSATVSQIKTVNQDTGKTNSATVVRGEQGVAGKVNDDAFAAKDGNVYVKKGDGQWQQVTKPAAPAGPTPTQASQAALQAQQQRQQQQQAQLQRNQAQQAQQAQRMRMEQQQRNIGMQRAQSFQNNRPPGGFRGGGGGGFRGGGGRR
jgi:hypothetical protein